MKSYAAVVKEVDSIADNLGMPVDDGIKRIVAALRFHDFPTDGSCEGHLDHGCPYPWVDIYAPEQEETSWITANNKERRRLSKLLDDFYLTSPKSPRFTFENIGIFGGFRLTPSTIPKNQPTEAELESMRTVFDAFANYLLRSAK